MFFLTIITNTWPILQRSSSLYVHIEDMYLDARLLSIRLPMACSGTEVQSSLPVDARCSLNLTCIKAYHDRDVFVAARARRQDGPDEPIRCSSAITSPALSLLHFPLPSRLTPSTPAHSSFSLSRNHSFEYVISSIHRLLDGHRLACARRSCRSLAAS